MCRGFLDLATVLASCLVQFPVLPELALGWSHWLLTIHRCVCVCVRVTCVVNCVQNPLGDGVSKCSLEVIGHHNHTLQLLDVHNTRMSTPAVYNVRHVAMATRACV